MPAPVQTYTAEELAREVAIKLNVFGPDEPADASAVQHIVQAYRNLYEEWFFRGYATWDADLTPLYAVEPLKVVLCARTSLDLRGEPFAQSEFDGVRMFLQSQAGRPSPAPARLTFY